MEIKNGIFVFHNLYIIISDITSKRLFQSVLRWPVDSILLAVFTVSPNRQYLGILTPTTPAQQGPITLKKNDYDK